MIFGIDQSITGTAVALINEKGKFVKGILIESGPTREKDGASRRMYRLCYIAEQVLQFIRENAGDEPYTVAREDYSYGSKGQVFELGELGGVIDTTLYSSLDNQCHGHYVMPIGTWKKFCLGNGNIAKDTSYLLKVFKEFGIEFKDNNVADAFMIGHTLWAMFKSAHNQDYFDKMTQDAKVALLKKASGLTLSKIKTVDFEMYAETMKEVMIKRVVFDSKLKQEWMNGRIRGKITAYPEFPEEDA